MFYVMADQVAVAVSGGGAVAVAVAVAGLTKRFFNHIQKDFLINVWGYKCGTCSCKIQVFEYRSCCTHPGDPQVQRRLIG